MDLHSQKMSRNTLIETVDRIMVAHLLTVLALVMLLVGALFVGSVGMRPGFFFLVAVIESSFLMLMFSSTLEGLSFRTLSKVQVSFNKSSHMTFIGAFGSLLMLISFLLISATEAWAGLIILGGLLWIAGVVGSASGKGLLATRYNIPYMRDKSFISAFVWPVDEFRGLREFKMMLREKRPIEPIIRDWL